MLNRLLMGVGLAVLVAGGAQAAGDPVAGEKVFKRCQACHVIDSDQNRVGPHLSGVIGRKAGTVDGFKYSDAMKKKGEEGLVWTEETIAEYLPAPKDFVPGNKMAFPGLKKPEEVQDVIAFIVSKQ